MILGILGILGGRMLAPLHAVFCPPPPRPARELYVPKAVPLIKWKQALASTNHSVQRRGPGTIRCFRVRLLRPELPT